MSKATLQCPDCSKRLKAPRGKDIEKGKCPACGRLIDIPAGAGTVPETRQLSSEDTDILGLYVEY